MHIDNRHFYGYLPVPLDPHQRLFQEVETFIHLLMEIMSECRCLLFKSCFPLVFLFK